MRLALIFFDQGTGMTEGPLGNRVDSSSNLKPSNLFGTQEYIATDYNKKSDIHKVLVQIGRAHV